MALVTGTEMTVLALFEPSGYPESLVDELRNAGVREDAVEVLSPLPIHETALLRPIRVPLHLIAIIAGLLGIGLGVMVTAGTALLYPIVTGAKPIVAPPVVGIIAFETMMLVAIVTTFAAMLIRLRSESRNAAEHDPRIDDGLIGVVLSDTGFGSARGSTGTSATGRRAGHPVSSSDIVGAAWSGASRTGDHRCPRRSLPSVRGTGLFTRHARATVLSAAGNTAPSFAGRLGAARQPLGANPFARSSRIQ